MVRKRKKAWFPVVGVVTIAVCGYAYAAVSWFPFTDPDSGFTVQFSGTPTVTHDDTNKAADGTAIPTAAYEVDHAKVQMVVSASDFGKLTIDPGGAIDGAVAALKEDAKQIVTDQVNMLDGQVGHELVYIDKDGNRTDDRIYVVNHHLYQACTVTAKDAGPDDMAEGDKFLASFHLTGK
jgi:hypothetical protein